MDTSSVLNSLSYIDEACYDANLEVGDALLEAYTKQADMFLLSNQTGIVMEGFEYKEGENILKTIFLYIPRLIVALVKEIKRRWDIYAKNKRYKKAYADFEKAWNEYLQLKGEYDNMSVDINLPHFYVVNEKKYIRTNIKNITEIIDFYTNMKKAFKSYEDAAKDTGDTIDFSAFNDVVYSGIRDVNEVIDSAHTFEFEYEGIVAEKITELIDVITKTCDSIKKSMESVEKWYSEAATKSVSSTLAERLLSDIRKLREIFTTVDSKVQAEVGAIYNDIITGTGACEKINKDIKTKRKEELHKELSDKTDEVVKKRDEADKLKAERDEAENSESPLQKFVPDLDLSGNKDKDEE